MYGSNQSELAWTVIPLLTVFVLCLVTTRTIKAVQQAVPSAEALLVTIIGHQWWWEMRYPALGIVTANAWHVPVSAQTQPMPTFLKLQSVDVAHIPSLKAKELSKLPREEAGVWSSGKDRIPRIPLSALRPGEAPGGHALPVVAVLAVRQSLRRHLGQSGQSGPPCRGDLSAYHPHGAGEGPDDLLPARGSRVACVHALRGAMSGPEPGD